MVRKSYSVLHRLIEDDNRTDEYFSWSTKVHKQEKMMSVTVRQHYVWRHYLRPWAIGESIWVYIKQSDKVLNTNLMNVGQEKYFYELSDFTDEEEELLRKLVNSIGSDLLKDFNADLYSLFTSASRFKKLLVHEENKEEYESEVKKMGHRLKWWV